MCDPCARVRARVSRVCPGSPRCLFTGTVLYTDAPSGLQEIRSSGRRAAARDAIASRSVPSGGLRPLLPSAKSEAF